MAYARHTSVPTERSRAAIEKTLAGCVIEQCRLCGAILRTETPE